MFSDLRTLAVHLLFRRTVCSELWSFFFSTQFLQFLILKCRNQLPVLEKNLAVGKLFANLFSPLAAFHSSDCSLCSLSLSYCPVASLTSLLGLHGPFIFCCIREIVSKINVIKHLHCLLLWILEFPVLWLNFLWWYMKEIWFCSLNKIQFSQHYWWGSLSCCLSLASKLTTQWSCGISLVSVFPHQVIGLSLCWGELLQSNHGCLYGITLHIRPDCLLPFFPPRLPLSFLSFPFLFGLKFRITILSMNRVKQRFRNRWVKFCLMNIYFFIKPIDDFMTYFTNFACTNTRLNNSLCIR